MLFDLFFLLILNQPIITTSTFSLTSPQNSTSDSKTLRIDHADVLNERTVNGEQILILQGNVVCHKGGDKLNSDYAEYHRDSQVIYLQGNVHFIDKEQELFADEVTYNSLENRALAKGNVRVISLESRSELLATRAIYDREMKVLVAYERPQLIITKSLRPEEEQIPIYIWADSISFKSDLVISRGSVEIKREELIATSDSATYFVKDDKLLLRGSPRVDVPTATMIGDEIDVEMRANELRQTIARKVKDREARVELLAEKQDSISIETPDPSWVKADSIRLVFADGELDSLIAIENARSRYYFHVGKEKELRQNYVIGKEIVIKFTGSEVHQLEVISGGVGRYIYTISDTSSVEGQAEIAQ